MKKMTLLAAALIAVVPTLSLADAAKEQASIEAVCAKFNAAWKAGDAKARAAVFTEDATVINPMGIVAKGRAEIEKLFVEENKTIAKGTTHSMKIDMVRYSGDLAFVDGVITLTGMKSPDGKDMPPMSIRGVFQFVKKAGTWMVLDGRPNQIMQASAAN